MDNLNIFRPQKLNEFIGNVKICEILSIYLFSAKKRKASLDHVLLYGQPGVGKTSLANIISNELESHLISVSAPILKYPSDLINLIANINSGDVLFIDEFHRLNKEIEELKSIGNIGKKANILIYELKNKLHEFDINVFRYENVYKALKSLGYNETNISKALYKINANLDDEIALKEAIKVISNG